MPARVIIQDYPYVAFLQTTEASGYKFINNFLQIMQGMMMRTPSNSEGLGDCPQINL